MKKNMEKNLRSISEYPKIENILGPKIEQKFFKEVSPKKKHRLSFDVGDFKEAEYLVRPRCNSIEK